MALLAQMFNKENERDGYFQRVQAIDRNALPGLYRVYLFQQGPYAKRLRVLHVDKDHAEVLFNAQDAAQYEQVKRIIRSCGCLYAHSIYRLMDAEAERLPFFDMEDVLKIWDVHGAVPEECVLDGHDVLGARAEKVEAHTYMHADVIVTVTRAMQTHLQNKYGAARGRFINIPIFAANPVTEPRTADKQGDAGKPVVVYAGGLHTWQNIDKMRELVEATWWQYEYRFFVSDPKRLKKMWAGRVPLDQVLITSVPSKRMHEAYRGCQYGLLLRDDNVINNVACPTKLIEYMQHGIVPVLLSGRIGDFAGMGYVGCEEFRWGIVPSEEHRRKTADGNKKLLGTLINKVHIGCLALWKSIASGN